MEGLRQLCAAAVQHESEEEHLDCIRGIADGLTNRNFRYARWVLMLQSLTPLASEHSDFNKVLGQGVTVVLHALRCLSQGISTTHWLLPRVRLESTRVRMLADEALNRIIKALLHSHIGRIQVELYNELKVNLCWQPSSISKPSVASKS